MRVGEGIPRRCLTVLCAAGFGMAGLAATPATAAEGQIVGAGQGRAVPGSYVVVLKDEVAPNAVEVNRVASGLAARFGGHVGRTYASALRGFSVTMGEPQARSLAADPAVAYVEQDAILTISQTQSSPPSWGLDRADQRDLPLNEEYQYATTADNVNAYVIDTGIRTTHSTFGGRAASGYDFVDDDTDATDCNGHGTHVAGTIGGGEYGMAKGARLYGVRVLDCQGSGTTSQVVAGIDWVTNNAVKPAVANMSLGGGVQRSIDDAVRKSINAGVTYALAAGNGDALGRAQDACRTSPARVTEAITVSATDRNDKKASWANYGRCVDLFAPGVGITSAWIDDDTATKTISGTSMATPHVAGAAALYLAANPSASPQQVGDALVAAATDGKVDSPGRNSPNKLLYTGAEG